ASTSRREIPTLYACLERIRKHNSDINAFTAFLDAQECRAAPRSAVGKRPLDGLPLAVKDNLCTRSLPTSCASNMLRGFVSPFDATAVRLLTDAGAVVVGKTNMDEFGMGSANVYSAYGPAFNPWPLLQGRSFEAVRGLRRVAGGSSGGSAAAVAAGMCASALGSDTGGSVRLPAAYCGVVGLKPSYGLVSRHGLVAYANSMDTVGVIAPDVDLTSKLFELISKHDPLDSTSLSEELRAALPKTDTPAKEGDLSGMRIGIPQEYLVTELSPSVLRAWRDCVGRLRKAGAQVVRVSCPHTRHALGAYYVIAMGEASSNLSRYDGVRYGASRPIALGYVSYR
ncbi:MAG: A subunit of glutamyl-tRNA amidotransferase, partial [Olpidium bornovanus]